MYVVREIICGISPLNICHAEITITVGVVNISLYSWVVNKLKYNFRHGVVSNDREESDLQHFHL